MLTKVYGIGINESKGNAVTKIGLPETRLGIIPGAGGTQRATRILGVSKTKELIFTGRMLTASDAKDIGLLLFPLSMEWILIL